MTYRKPEPYEEYRMRLLGFKTLKEYEDWMNTPQKEEDTRENRNPPEIEEIEPDPEWEAYQKENPFTPEE